MIHPREEGYVHQEHTMIYFLSQMTLYNLEVEVFNPSPDDRPSYF